MTFSERNEQERLLYEAFKGIKYRNYDEQKGLEAEFLSQFTDTAIHMIISQMISKGVKIEPEPCKAEGCTHCMDELAFEVIPCDYCNSCTIGCNCGEYEAWKNKTLKVDYDEDKFCSQCGKKLR